MFFLKCTFYNSQNIIIYFLWLSKCFCISLHLNIGSILVSLKAQLRLTFWDYSTANPIFSSPLTAAKLPFILKHLICLRIRLFTQRTSSEGRDGDRVRDLWLCGRWSVLMWSAHQASLGSLSLEVLKLGHHWDHLGASLDHRWLSPTQSFRFSGSWGEAWEFVFPVLPRGCWPGHPTCGPPTPVIKRGVQRLFPLQCCELWRILQQIPSVTVSALIISPWTGPASPSVGDNTGCLLPGCTQTTQNPWRWLSHLRPCFLQVAVCVSVCVYAFYFLYGLPL